MTFPSSEIVGVINALLPGFLTTWVYYALTAHPKKGSFERVIEALIFTGIVQVIVLLIQKTLFILGKVYTLCSWTSQSSFVLSIVIAVLLGIVFSLFANKDWFHKFLRESKWFKCIGGVTSRTSFPSEWFNAFNKSKRYITLHLVGDRRLYGWPCEWPDHPDSGHFVIMEPEWLLDDNRRIPVHRVV